MEERNIKLTLDKAKEWYNSDSKELKEVALQAYTEEELDEELWKKIKTFADACDALGIDAYFNPLKINKNSSAFARHLEAIRRLDIIRQALNKDYKPSLIQDAVYCPWVRLYKNYDTAKNVIINNDWKFCGKVKIEGTSYYLVGGSYIGCGDGLGNFRYGYGGVYATLGLLCCKSKEIAQHMSKYFAREIFDAIYIQHDNYEWNI
jgi:hypothetical protein